LIARIGVRVDCPADPKLSGSGAIRGLLKHGLEGSSP
jgi:hypothetical protein